MIRKFRRHKDFEVTVQVTSDTFIRPPREAQRHWILNRVLYEVVDDLQHLDAAARRYVPGADHAALPDRTQAVLAEHEIMEDWQIPVMEAMAEVVAASHGDVLEVGFGRGVASDLIQEQGVRSHTIVECNDAIVEHYHVWKQQYPESDLRLIHGLWQDTVDQFGQYDGIFFHTYPLNQDEFLEHVVQSPTFAAHFFAVAAAHLRPGGVFTYLSNEADSFSRGHQRLLFDHFSSFTLQKVDNLPIAANSRDDLWADSMVVVGARK